MSGKVQAMVEQAKHMTPDQRLELVAAILRIDWERQTLDAAFASVWADPARNAAEAELDREADAEIDRGGGARGSIDDIVASIDG